MLAIAVGVCSPTRIACCRDRFPPASTTILDPVCIRTSVPSMVRWPPLTTLTVPSIDCSPVQVTLSLITVSAESAEADGTADARTAVVISSICSIAIRLMATQYRRRS